MTARTVEPLAGILRDGFSHAHHRIGLVALDILWKAVWGVLTCAGALLFLFWFMSAVQSVEWEQTGIPAIDGLIALALLREFWNANRSGIAAGVFLLVAISAVLWIVLEAWCRRRIVGALSPDDSAAAAPTFPLNVYLASGFVRTMLLAVCGGLLLSAFLAGAAMIAVVTFLAFIFFLTLADTLIRADAIDLLGTDLIRVAGLLGILMSFEGLIVTSFAVVIVAGFLNVASQGEAVAMMGAAAIGAVLLNVLHGYLLLVRFSAIAIMRRNVVEV